MREIDLKEMTIVQAGLAWPHAQNPTSREMLPLLERKEQYVSWLQPKTGGVDDQLPSMQINGRFFALSLRLQKVLFRHVRLQNDFVNRERTADGQLKLRIPVALYQDKKKTALRFMVVSQLTSRGLCGLCTMPSRTQQFQRGCTHKAMTVYGGMTACKARV